MSLQEARSQLEGPLLFCPRPWAAGLRALSRSSWEASAPSMAQRRQPQFLVEWVPLALLALPCPPCGPLLEPSSTAWL